MKRNWEKMLKKAAQCAVFPVNLHLAEVQSPSGRTYMVRRQADGRYTCECEFYTRTGHVCSHIIAAIGLKAAMRLDKMTENGQK